jgi:hypothetical protein
VFSLSLSRPLLGRGWGVGVVKQARMKGEGERFWCFFVGGGADGYGPFLFIYLGGKGDTVRKWRKRKGRRGYFLHQSEE